MVFEQNILGTTRSACMTAIYFIWTIEVLYLLALAAGLVFAIVPQILPTVQTPFEGYSLLTIIPGILLLAVLSVAFTGIALAFLASAVTNIDSRNIQARMIELKKAQRWSHPSNSKKKLERVDVDLMGMRAERIRHSDEFS